MAKKVASLHIQLDANSAKLISELQKSIAATKKMSRTVQKEANRIKYAFNKIRRAAQVVASAYIFATFIQRLQAAVVAMEHAEDQMALLQARFQRFSRSGDVEQTIARVKDTADELGISLTDASEGFTKLLVATQEIGTSEETLSQIQKNIVLLGRASGTSAQEMQGAMRQLIQGLSSGRLAGEELRSVLENLPLVAFEIADKMGVGLGALRELGAEGKITSRIVIEALEEVGVKASDLPETFQMATDRMKNAWTELLAVLGSKLETSKFVNRLTEIMEFWRDFFGDPLTDLQERQDELNEILSRPFNRGRYTNDQLNAFRVELELLEDLFKREARLKRTREEQIAEANAARFLTPIDTQKITSRFRGEMSPEYWEAQIKANKSRLKYNLQVMDTMWKEFNDVAEQEDYLAKGFRIKVGKLPETAKPAFDKMAEYSKQAARNIQDAFAEFLFDPFEEGIRGLVKNFADAIREMLANQAALQLLTAMNNSIFGGMFDLTGRATGGPVSAGTPYLVGERGPEIMVPGSSGNIIPNSALGGVSIVNNFSAGADVATIRSEIIPMLEATQKASVAEVMQRRSEGTL